METKTKYAIRCSTEEQARECDIERVNLWTEYYCVYSKPLRIFLSIGAVDKDLYTIITYDEALEKGLLGEKNEEPYYCDWRCPECGNTNTHKVCSKCGYKIFNL